MYKILTGLVLCAGVATVSAQQFPTRPISMVVPFSPGGTSDVTARPLAQAMTENLGQSVIVENKAGAGGAVGMTHVSKATPDGYTVMVALPSISIIPSSDRVTGRKSLYSPDQFVPIARITADPTAFIVHADSPWKTLDEFVKDAKKSPKKISYSSSGVYGTTHIAMEMFAQAAGLELLHVPYSGGGKQVLAVVAKEVQATPQALAPVLPHIKAGNLRALAVWGSERLEALPDVPSMKELGYDVQFTLWTGVFAPKGTPEPALKRLESSVEKAVQDPKFVATLTGMQTPVKFLGSEKFAEFVAEDSKRLDAIVEKMGRLE